MIFTDAVSPDKIPLYYQIDVSSVHRKVRPRRWQADCRWYAERTPVWTAVTDGWNGGLYTSFESFQKWITAFCGDAAETQQLSRHAVQTAERFSAAGFAEKVEFVTGFEN
ncbi:MAG: hypothetical protein ACLUOF_00190 [Ruminococcus sp.]